MPLLLALALLAPTATTAADARDAEPKLVQDCTAHQFETTIGVTRGGKPAQSKVKLCGTPGQSDAEWIGTLKDAIAKVSANPQMPETAKKQIISAVNLEIVRLGAAPAVAASTPSTSALVNAPPLPAPRRSATTTAPLYSALPPFPPPVSAPVAGTIATSAAPVAGAPFAAAAPFVPPLPRPRLSFTCFTAGDVGGDGPCFAFDRDTRITVRAGEPLNNTLLRFVRGGDERADYPLPPLAKGRSASFQLPRAVCSRAVGGKLTIRIVRGPANNPAAAQVVGTEGPYNLRC
jgi:hypothetical protein